MCLFLVGAQMIPNYPEWDVIHSFCIVLVAGGRMAFFYAANAPRTILPNRFTTFYVLQVASFSLPIKRLRLAPEVCANATALQGQDILAQGNALGTDVSTQIAAPSGQGNIAMVYLALSGRQNGRVSRNPGRCPGL